MFDGVHCRCDNCVVTAERFCRCSEVVVVLVAAAPTVVVAAIVLVVVIVVVVAVVVELVNTICENKCLRFPTR